MRATGINHVSVSAIDLEESVTFYEELLGMTRIPTYEFGFPVQYLRVGDAQLHIFVRQAETPMFHHFAVTVDDFDAVYRRAAAMSAFDATPFHAHAYELPDGGVQAYVRDPGGNLVEINWPDIRTVAADVRAEIGRLHDRVPQEGDALRATLFPELHPEFGDDLG
jgi:lactoylglutathione lyase